MTERERREIVIFVIDRMIEFSNDSEVKRSEVKEVYGLSTITSPMDGTRGGQKYHNTFFPFCFVVVVFCTMLRNEVCPIMCSSPDRVTEYGR